MAMGTPNDIYYLTERVSVTTADGITAFPPGTVVKRIGEDAGLIKVQTADGSSFPVQPIQITQDPATAAYYSKADADALRRFAAARQDDLKAALARQAAMYNSRPVSTPTPVPLFGTSLDRGAYDQQKEVADPKPETKKKKR